MSKSSDRLVWIALHTTGPDPREARVLEVASLVTDGELAVLAEGPQLVIHQPAAALEGMEPTRAALFTASGLLERVGESSTGLAEAEQQTVDFLSQHVKAGVAPLASRSIHHVRPFLHQQMPALNGVLHYRNVDLATLEQLVHRWYPAAAAARPAPGPIEHVVDDIHNSIATLGYYRRTVFLAPSAEEPGAVAPSA